MRTCPPGRKVPVGSKKTEWNECVPFLFGNTVHCYCIVLFRQPEEMALEHQHSRTCTAETWSDMIANARTAGMAPDDDRLSLHSEIVSN